MNFGMLVFYLLNKRKVNAEFGNSRFCIIFLARKSSKADAHIQIYYCAKYRFNAIILQKNVFYIII